MIERLTLKSTDYNNSFRQLEEKIEEKINADGGVAYASCREILGYINERVAMYSSEVQTNSNVKYRIDELINLAAICIVGAASIESESVDG